MRDYMGVGAFNDAVGGALRLVKQISSGLSPEKSRMLDNNATFESHSRNM